MFGFEAACISGAAHLLSFTGTDTVPAIDFLEEYYGADADKELVGASVPATEHSVMCMGTQENEIETFDRLITKTYPKGIVSIVSDTWDFWKVITEFLPQLETKIMARDGKVVIRPDTGDPVEIICGARTVDITDVEGDFSRAYLKPAYEHGIRFAKEDDKIYEILTRDEGGETMYSIDRNQDATNRPEVKGAIDCMWEIFGGTKTDRGYRLLDSHVGLIYGDSITIERCKEICQGLMDKGFCSFNVVLGIGSYTYQYATRDTYGFAVKATYGEVNGEARNIFKTPKTGDGTKNSAKGLIAIYKSENDNGFGMVDGMTWHEVNNCELKAVFKDGKLFNEQTLAEIRQRLNEDVSEPIKA